MHLGILEDSQGAYESVQAQSRNVKDWFSLIRSGSLKLPRFQRPDGVGAAGRMHDILTADVSTSLRRARRFVLDPFDPGIICMDQGIGTSVGDVVDQGDKQGELLRQFKDAISGMDREQLGQLAARVLSLGPELRPPERPHLRRPPREEVGVYRLRVDLNHAKPPIWRRLDVRSDVTLDVVHKVLQASFDWLDYHLHRFALGDDPFDRHSELFLCPFDVDEGDDDGTPASDVRLDETLQEPGDVLHYVYDYGDNWDLTIRLEEVRPAPEDTPTAVCVDGRRAAPPEDSGGIREAGDLAQVLDDPAHFDVNEVNQALRDPLFVLHEYGVHPRLVEIANRLRFSEAGGELAANLMRLATTSPEISPADMEASLTAHLWFLDRAAGDGIELTSAGYLKPADVEVACTVVPAMGDWIGTKNREVHCGPLLDFRRSLQAFGLLRKYKGRLLLTRAGKAARGNPAALWKHLAARLLPDQPGTFAQDASLLLLAYVAMSPEARVPVERIIQLLTELGWRSGDGEPMEPWDVIYADQSPWDVLVNVSDRPRSLGEVFAVSKAAAALAHATLVGSSE